MCSAAANQDGGLKPPSNSSSLWARFAFDTSLKFLCGLTTRTVSLATLLFLRLVFLSPTLSAVAYSSTTLTPGACRSSSAHHSRTLMAFLFSIFFCLYRLSICCSIGERMRTRATHILSGSILSVLCTARHRFGGAGIAQRGRKDT